MAILKQRIKKKNDSGTYDTLHVETSASLVLMANGNTLEYEMYHHSVPAHTHAASDITSGTLTVSRGGTGRASLLKGSYLVGNNTSAVTSSAFMPITVPVGEYAIFDNYKWIVAHRDNDRLYLVLSVIYSDRANFGSNTTYKGSTLANWCLTFQNAMSSNALAKCVDWTVNDVTQKVNVPSHEQMNGGFSWFNSDERRKAYNTSGRTWSYWTSSPYNSNYVWNMSASGNLIYSSPTDSLGFRPCVCYVP